MVMSLHRLTVADGYAYLSRQVASGDSTRRRGQSLEDFYSETRNPPGRWLGSGAADLGVSGEVSREQMLALFKHGAHPERKALVAQQVAAGTHLEAARSSAQLGRRFAVFSHGRRRAVAGYDLVFSPVKSVSLLWALGTEQVRREVESAHAEAVADVVGWVEANAVVTRPGAGSRDPQSTHGLIGAAFDHRESRHGDPDLHTHVAVSSKVRSMCDGPGGQGRWLALDSAVLHCAAAAASERYTTRVEDALVRRLGVDFAPRADTLSPGRSVVREVVDVPEELIGRFSRRRAHISERHCELVSEFRSRHGRHPSATVQVRMAQRATLETRPNKGPARPLATQLADWAEQATAISGAAALAGLPTGGSGPVVASDLPAAQDLATATLTALAARRASWGRWHVIAEVERQTRPLRPGSPSQRDALVREVTEAALGPAGSVALGGAHPGPPGSLQHRRPHSPAALDTGQYTSRAVLEAEQQLVAASRERLRWAAGRGPSAGRCVSESRPSESHLNPSADLVSAFARSDRVLVAAISPAGPTKTAALRQVCEQWDRARVRVVPLASCPQSADALAGELGRQTADITSYLAGLERPPARDRALFRLGAGDMILVDEAGFAGTPQLARLLGHARAHGAAVRLLGDQAQLAAVPSGAALRLITSEHQGPQPGVPVRFLDPEQATAAAAVAAGDPRCVDFYDTRDRLRAGSHHDMVEAAYRGWVSDIRCGQASVILTPSCADATALSARARALRITLAQVGPRGVPLADATEASVGDWVLTQVSDRTLITFKGRDFVKTGDPWTVIEQHPDHSLTVQHQRHRGRLTLPPHYVHEHLQLAYAVSTERARAIVVDTAHPVLGPRTSRQSVHLAVTRARAGTTFYLTDDEPTAASTRPQRERARRLLTEIVTQTHDTGPRTVHRTTAPPYPLEHLASGRRTAAARW